MASSSSDANATNVNVDKQGNQYFEMTRTRRISLSKFRGKARVDIREYYQAAGDENELLPGKRGISLSLEDFNKLKELIPEIDKALERLK